MIPWLAGRLRWWHYESVSLNRGSVVIEAEAKALVKAVLLPSGQTSRPSREDLRQALGVLASSQTSVDDPRLAREIMESATGGSLLHQVAWRAGAGEMEMETACTLARVLLEMGADPNRCVEGYRPVDMLVAGVHNGPDQCVDIEPLVETMIKGGLNHNSAGRYSLPEIADLLIRDGVAGNVVNLLEVGPDANALEHSTAAPSACRSRRSL